MSLSQVQERVFNSEPVGTETKGNGDRHTRKIHASSSIHSLPARNQPWPFGLCIIEQHVRGSSAPPPPPLQTGDTLPKRWAFGGQGRLEGISPCPQAVNGRIRKVVKFTGACVWCLSSSALSACLSVCVAPPLSLLRPLATPVVRISFLALARAYSSLPYEYL